jgi:hypothetical protein
MPEINFRIHARGILPVLLLTGLVAGGCGDAGATITRLTVGSAGPDPYVLMSGTDRQKIKPARRAGGTTDGDAPGLYGGTRQEATCDPAKLVTFLQANPDKAAAWASVHRIRPAEVPRFVSRLTPVLLRVDTLVTNHGFKNGRATRMPAVLQAGMGVLVNEYGTPVVKCNCGNPLSRPDQKISAVNAKYTGSAWPGFSERKVTKIRPRRAVTAFVLVDPEATIGFQRPAATTGGMDGPPIEVPAEDLAVPSPGDSGGLDPSAPPQDSPPPQDLPSDGTDTGTPPGEDVPDPDVPGEDPGLGPDEQAPDPDGEATGSPPTSLEPPQGTVPEPGIS